MVSSPSLSFQERQNARWHALPTAEKLKEFRELTQSPYWPLLPEEIKVKVRNLVAAAAPLLFTERPEAESTAAPRPPAE